MSMSMWTLTFGVRMTLMTSCWMSGFWWDAHSSRMPVGSTWATQPKVSSGTPECRFHR